MLPQLLRGWAGHVVFALVALSVASGQSLQDNVNQGCAASGSHELAARTYDAASLSLPSGCTLIGKGRGLTVIRQSPLAARSGIPFLSITSGELRALTVDGNEANQRVTRPDANISCVRIMNSTRVRLLDVEVRNCVGAGVDGGGWNDVTIQNLTAANWSKGQPNVGAVNLYPWARSSRVTIDNPNIDGSVSHASGIKLAATPVNVLNNASVRGGTIIVGDGGAAVTVGIEFLPCHETACNTGTDVRAIQNANISGVTVKGENTTNRNVFGINFSGLGGTADHNTVINARLYCIETIGSYLTVQYNRCIGSGLSTVDSNVFPSVTSLDRNDVSFNTYTDGTDVVNGDVQIYAPATGVPITNLTFSNNTSTRPAASLLFVNPGKPISGTFSRNQVSGPRAKQDTWAFRFFFNAATGNGVSGEASNNTVTNWGPGATSRCIYNDRRNSLTLSNNSCK